MGKEIEIGTVRFFEDPDSHATQCSIQMGNTGCIQELEDYAIKAIIGMVTIYTGALKSIRNDLEKKHAEMKELADFSIFVNERKEMFINGFEDTCKDLFAMADPLAGSPEWVREIIRSGNVNPDSGENE